MACSAEEQNFVKAEPDGASLIGSLLAPPTATANATQRSLLSLISFGILTPHLPLLNSFGPLQFTTEPETTRASYLVYPFLPLKRFSGLPFISLPSLRPLELSTIEEIL
jgi:hypothetical protein